MTAKHEFQFTHDWFSGNIPVWQQHLACFRDKPICALEIGCFEGRATTWLLENILTHPESRIAVVDTFEGSREHKEAAIDFSDTFSRFTHNIEPWKTRVDCFKGESAHWLRLFSRKELIYVDGDHMASSVLTDAVLAWHLLLPGGIMIFDDYLWGEPQHPFHWKPRLAIDAFLQCFEGQYEVLRKEYQVFISRKA